MSSLYEQIKADLGYLKLDAAAGVFATLAEQARTDDWTHIEFLAKLIAKQAGSAPTAPTDPDTTTATPNTRRARNNHPRLVITVSSGSHQPSRRASPSARRTPPRSANQPDGTATNSSGPQPLHHSCHPILQGRLVARKGRKAHSARAARPSSS